MSDELNPINAARDKELGLGEGKQRGRKRRKVSYLTLNKIEYVDYKDFSVLRRFINDRGKILSSRQTGNNANQQRMIARAIRRARELALLPFVVTEMSADRREYTPRGPRRDRNYGAPREEAQAEVATAQAAAPAPEAAETPASE
ncbi:MAG: 30S ribosomal protein S18 [Armatimonadetes bacterium]|nr:30S ribosomal protein S18 [Armatimonadota bacterium]